MKNRRVSPFRSSPIASSNEQFKIPSLIKPSEIFSIAALWGSDHEFPALHIDMAASCASRTISTLTSHLPHASSYGMGAAHASVSSESEWSYSCGPESKQPHIRHGLYTATKLGTPNVEVISTQPPLFWTKRELAGKSVSTVSLATAAPAHG